ncbi:hypothetical protein [Veronia nyctiphanis]|uniref:hypothetical protein n=1 Tax=Veronia nyctiphanis TaxID=1278244 RepID=UPI002E25F578
MTIPNQSELTDYAKGAYFSDSFSIETPHKNKTAIELYLTLRNACRHGPPFSWI